MYFNFLNFLIFLLFFNLNTQKSEQTILSAGSECNIPRFEEYKNNSDYSGVYEGIIEFPLCCEMFEKGNGYIVFDLSEEPYKILFDGVFLENFIFERNIIKEVDEYSYYPKNVIGVFEDNNRNQGFWYNFADVEGDGTGGKSFLKKTGNLSKAKELINNALIKKNKFDDFFKTLKNAIEQKDFQTLSTFAAYPVKDNSSLVEKYGLNKVIRNSKDLISRFKLIFTNDFYSSDYMLHAVQYEDHHPDFGGKYIIMTDIYMIIENINDDFKLTEIHSPWG